MRNVDFKSYPEFCHPNTSTSDEADGGAIVLAVGPIDDEASRGFDAEPAEVAPAPPPPFIFVAPISPASHRPRNYRGMLNGHCGGENATGRLWPRLCENVNSAHVLLSTKKGRSVASVMKIT